MMSSRALFQLMPLLVTEALLAVDIAADTEQFDY